MGEYIRAGSIGDFPEGMPKKVFIKGKDIMLTEVDGKYYAISNRCLHLGGQLSEGKLEGTIITCPRHFSKFDITNGSVVRWLRGSGITASIVKTIRKSKTLDTYPVKVEDDSVFIEL